MWRIIVALVLALTSVGLSALPVMAVGTWTTKTSMPAARSWAAAEVINGILYVAGGHDGVTGGTTTLQAYNPTTDSWSTLAAMPGRRYLGDGAGVINGELYVAGGWNYPDSGIPQSQLFVYNPGTNSWSSKAAMPTLSGDGATGVINGKLYVTTAANGFSGYRDFLHVYDPATDSWSSLASSPNVHDAPAFGVIDNKFYVAGGGDANGTPSDKLDVYDPATNIWTTKASMPAVLRGSVGAIINGKLYVIGGSTASVYYSTVYVYDPSANTWTTETSMPTARTGAAGGVINGVIYVAGGTNSSGILATVEALTLDSVTYTITASAGANGAISPSGAVVVNQGASQSFSITPSSGYHIADVLVDGSSVGAVTSYTFTNITANHSIAASFAITNQPPFALFTYSPAEPKANQIITFNASTSFDSDGTIVSYSWQFGDGGNGTGVTVEHTYANANQYSVILTVTDNSGATDVEAKTITVAQAATPPPTTGRRSLPDPSTWAMVGSGLVAGLFYIGLSRLRQRLSRS